ncbi:hypothetical protein GWK47_039954 [Chionoecetes opilio]|uniref:Uncharacterized protein n=1 Tax=Chionoecetes opilio TaxID=41210 RepID=A0A8J5CLE2_CHIOP|nr:hypothetical protein GWK47_039954 [Chionoecetes opilio]
MAATLPRPHTAGCTTAMAVTLPRPQHSRRQHCHGGNTATPLGCWEGRYSYTDRHMYYQLENPLRIFPAAQPDDAKCLGETLRINNPKYDECLCHPETSRSPTTPPDGYVRASSPTTTNRPSAHRAPQPRLCAFKPCGNPTLHCDVDCLYGIGGDPMEANHLHFLVVCRHNKNTLTVPSQLNKYYNPYNKPHRRNNNVTRANPSSENQAPAPPQKLTPAPLAKCGSRITYFISISHDSLDRLRNGQPDNRNDIVAIVANFSNIYIAWTYTNDMGRPRQTWIEVNNMQPGRHYSWTDRTTNSRNIRERNDSQDRQEQHESQAHIERQTVWNKRKRHDSQDRQERMTAPPGENENGMTARTIENDRTVCNNEDDMTARRQERS